MSTTAAFMNFANLYDVNDLGSLGISRAGFQRSLIEAQQSLEPGTSSSKPNDEISLEAVYVSIAETLERKSENAQTKANELEARAGDATDPAKAEILAKRAEIKEERAENLARNAAFYDTFSDFPAVGNERLENFYTTLAGTLRENAEYHEERGEDLVELADLVRENGHDCWADKILARAGVSIDRSESLTDSAERILETVPSNSPETVDENDFENSSGDVAGNGGGGNSGGLSAEADPADLNASDDNQAALEGRFIALYERLMEKQVSFKESVEPFKTDNQNAGKG